MFNRASDFDIIYSVIWIKKDNHTVCNKLCDW